MKYFAIDAVLEMRKRTLMKRIKKIYPPWKIYSGKLSNFLFFFHCNIQRTFTTLKND